ncbi:MAG TPA: LysE family transporter [Candidatus Saccharimonadales bacterium]|nr:LysE family transporter [Candidatus Saccharimonadales bacterium]
MEPSTILLAAITGLISGLLLSMPIGPVNLTIINEGACRGFVRGMLVGLGASAMELIYCTIAFTGFSSFFDSRVVKASMEVFSFAFLLFLGMKFLTAKTVAVPGRIEARVGQRLHPHSAFMTGFVRVLGNLGVLLFWIVLAANFMSHDWVADTLTAKAACIGGVAVGTNLWFCVLSYGVSRGHGRFSESTLVRMQHISGLCLIAVGLFDGGHIVWQLARHRI